MISVPAKKWPCLIFTVYLVIAVMGSFTFLMAENLRFDESGGKLSGVNGSFLSMEYAADWLTDDATKIDKANGSSSSPLRNGVLRVLVFAGQDAAVHRAGLPLAANYQPHGTIEKKIIPLKLRI